MTRMFRGLVAFLVLVGLSYGNGVEAQLSPLARGDGGDLPIEIFAEDGIEWQQERSVVVARGNARAIRGEVEVKADTLSAYYRKASTGDSEIWRVEAEGNVKIATPTDTAYAQKGIYDVDSGILVLRTRGQDTEIVRVVGKNGDISAHEQMEFWEQKQMFVARGDARAVQGDRMVSADVLVAYFDRTASGEDRVQRVEAFDDVVIETPQETVRAQHGIYRVDDGVASVLGEVKITRGPNQLNGCSAEVNLNTGISKLFGCPDGSQKGQVEGLIQPRKASGDDGTGPRGKSDGSR
ncbi:MAG: LptA/OstA family protein [Hyphomicrobium sp.]